MLFYFCYFFLCKAAPIWCWCLRVSRVLEKKKKKKNNETSKKCLPGVLWGPQAYFRDCCVVRVCNLPSLFPIDINIESYGCESPSGWKRWGARIRKHQYARRHLTKVNCFNGFWIPTFMRPHKYNHFVPSCGIYPHYLMHINRYVCILDRTWNWLGGVLADIEGRMPPFVAVHVDTTHVSVPGI